VHLVIVALGDKVSWGGSVGGGIGIRLRGRVGLEKRMAVRGRAQGVCPGMRWLRRGVGAVGRVQNALSAGLRVGRGGQAVAICGRALSRAVEAAGRGSTADRRFREAGDCVGGLVTSQCSEGEQTGSTVLREARAESRLTVFMDGAWAGERVGVRGRSGRY